MSVEKRGAPERGLLAELLATMTPGEQQEWRTLNDVLERVTGTSGELWQDSLVGFGRLNYRRGSGSRGSWFLLGLGWRRRLWVIYATGGFEDNKWLRQRIGRHKLGRSCLYLKGLDGVSLEGLEAFLRQCTIQAEEPPVILDTSDH